MGVFSRVSDIIAANISGLLDRAENPELMIGQVIREMEQGLCNARQFAATAIAAERRIGRELEQNRKQSVFWKTKARDALARGREDLARGCLERKQEHEDLVHSLESQYEQTIRTNASVRMSLRALEARLAEARRKQRSLVARHRAALARVEVQSVGGFADFGTSAGKFNRLENRLQDYEDELSAQAEVCERTDVLDLEFADTEREQAIRQELEALKKEQTGS